MTSKFCGHYIEIIPYACYNLKFLKTNHHYTWGKVKLCINNILLGKFTLNNTGCLDVINKETNDVCHLNFVSYSMFKQTSPNKVYGIVKDTNSIAKYVIDGTFSDKLNYASVKEIKRVESISDYDILVKEQWELLWQREKAP